MLEKYKQYKLCIHQIKEDISNGKVYQVNYTFPIRLFAYGQYESLFLQLMKKQTTPYSVLIYDDEFCIISLSPELFFFVEENQITFKPMKGTRKKIPLHQ